MEHRLGFAVAEAFALGTPTAPPAPVGGGGSHLLWRLRTDRGEWAVKRLNRSTEQWWRADYTNAATIELAAAAAGIAMPRPVEPLSPALPLLAELPEGSFQVHEWCPGSPVDTGVPVVRNWIGDTLAAIHRLEVPADLARAAVHPPHPVADWHEWLDNAPPAESDLVSLVREQLPAIARGTSFVDTARAEIRLTPAFSHRDVRPHNMLQTPHGPVLLDWDSGGAGHAEWEAVSSALVCARGATRSAPDRATFEGVLRAYAAAGGAPIAAVPASFGGLIESQLTAAAWLLWRSLGHRPVTPVERDLSRAQLIEMLGDLRAALDRLGEWTEWLPKSY